MRTAEELVIDALKRDFKRLSQIAEKAKSEAEEYMNVGSELISINEDFSKIVKSGVCNKASVKRLEGLQIRKNKADKIMKKDLVKLMDKESSTAMDRDTLGQEIQIREYRIKGKS